jgi:sn-glycerol 3-phosphate transport system permease protein
MAADAGAETAAATASGITSGRRRYPVKSVVWYQVQTVLSLLVLFPVYMALVRALSPAAAYILNGSPPYPVDTDWGVWSNAFSRGGLGSRLVISTVVTTIIVTAQVTTSILAAYAFAFLRFPGRRLVFLVFMATLLLPIEVTLIPNVATMQSWGLINSIPALSVPFLATALGTFLIRQGFLGVPRDLRDASALDGFGHLAFLWRVAIPVTRPVIASFTLIAFLSAWNQYTWPRAVTTEARYETVQIALRTLSTGSPETSNYAFAGALIAALPVVVLLIVFQRQLIRGLTAGAVKG